MPTLLNLIRKPFGDLKVAIVGDIEHSRVAKSEIYILNKLGVKEVRVIGPELLMPRNIAESECEELLSTYGTRA